MRLDDHTPALPTAHYHRSQQQELAPALVLVGGDGQTPAPFVDPADRRRYTLQHSCRMVQVSSSWPLWVDSTDLCCLRDLMMMMSGINKSNLMAYDNLETGEPEPPPQSKIPATSPDQDRLNTKTREQPNDKLSSGSECVLDGPSVHRSR